MKFEVGDKVRILGKKYGPELGSPILTTPGMIGIVTKCVNNCFYYIWIPDFPAHGVISDDPLVAQSFKYLMYELEPV